MSNETRMTVREFCLYKTEPFQLVVICQGGYAVATAWIDTEDLFRLPPDIAETPVIDHSHGFIDVVNPYNEKIRVPCVQVDIE